MSAIQAFIFDLDGVITDTAEYHFRAWKQLADEENLPFTREDNEQLRGLSRRDSLMVLLKGKTVSEETMQVWMERKNNYYRAFLHSLTPQDLLPGVGAFLEEARSAGLRLGLGSASKNAAEVLQGLGIGDLFDAVGDGYAVSKAKPAPDLFIWVAGRMDVLPPACVVFEDAEAGVTAALAAGMYCVGLGPQSRVGAAHLCHPSLESLSVSTVLNTLNKLPPPAKHPEIDSAPNPS